MLANNIIVVVFLIGTTLAQNPVLTATSQDQTPSFLTENKSLIILFLFLLLLLAAIIYDRRNGSPYITIIRRKSQELLQRIRNALAKRKLPKKEKLSGDEAIPSSKEMHSNMFDTEKTYVQADINSIQEAVALERKLEAVSSLQLDEETPKVDLKEVFGQKDGQTSKRSKSKIRSRVQIKKSERESQESQETAQSKENDSPKIQSAFEVSKSQE